MTFTQILNNEGLTASEKIAKLSSLTTKAREAYGNQETEIAVPDVPTTEGIVSIKYLSDEDKVSLASCQIRNIANEAIATTECEEGAVLDREIERLVAKNPVLVNLLAKSESSYI